MFAVTLDEATARAVAAAGRGVVVCGPAGRSG